MANHPNRSRGRPPKAEGERLSERRVLWCDPALAELIDKAGNDLVRETLRKELA